MSFLLLTALLFACLLDRLLGEPSRWHPLVGFGNLAGWLERLLNRAPPPKPKQKWFGLLALLLLLIPITFLSLWLHWRLIYAGRIGAIAYLLLGAGILYWALGWRSLMTHLQQIQAALTSGNLEQTREAVGRIVSRDCSNSQLPDLRRAAIESALENTSDAAVGPIFWFLLAGIPGAVIYRLSNTLDALWGYRNERFRYFGWAAARWDDVLNLAPARLTAFAFVAVAFLSRKTSARGALNAWRTQAATMASPNAGPVMCAGAGALDLKLGGPALYNGIEVDKPWFGGQRSPEDSDLDRALALINRSLVLLLLLAASLLIGVSLA